jgi:hypothetical protein
MMTITFQNPRHLVGRRRDSSKMRVPVTSENKTNSVKLLRRCAVSNCAKGWLNLVALGMLIYIATSLMKANSTIRATFILRKKLESGLSHISSRVSDSFGIRSPPMVKQLKVVYSHIPWVLVKQCKRKLRWREVSI